MSRRLFVAVVMWGEQEDGTPFMMAKSDITSVMAMEKAYAWAKDNLVLPEFASIEYVGMVEVNE